MEKKIRNADKSTPRNRKGSRRNLSPMPEQSDNTRETLFTLPIGKNGSQQKPKTIEVENGVNNFYIVIPCAPSSPDRKSPLYLVETNSLGGPENGVWQCQECGAIRHTRKAWAKHAGMIPNIMGNCPGNGEQKNGN